MAAVPGFYCFVRGWNVSPSDLQSYRASCSSSYAWLFFDQTNCLNINNLAKKREEKDGEREKRKEYTIMEQ